MSLSDWFDERPLSDYAHEKGDVYIQTPPWIVWRWNGKEWIKDESDDTGGK